MSTRWYLLDTFVCNAANWIDVSFLCATGRAEDDHDGYGNDDDDDDVARDDVPMMLLELCRRAPEVRHMLWQPRLDFLPAIRQILFCSTLSLPGALCVVLLICNIIKSCALPTLLHVPPWITMRCTSIHCSVVSLPTPRYFLLLRFFDLC